MAQGLTEGALKHVGEDNSPTSNHSGTPILSNRSISIMREGSGHGRFKHVLRKKAHLGVEVVNDASPSQCTRNRIAIGPTMNSIVADVALSPSMTTRKRGEVVVVPKRGGGRDPWVRMYIEHILNLHIQMPSC